MNKLQLNSKKIIIWLCVNYGIFVLVFLVLGTLGSEYKAILWINFFLDIAICVISLVLNIILFFPKHGTSLFVKLVLLFITLALAAFTLRIHHAGMRLAVSVVCLIVAAIAYQLKIHKRKPPL